jgi:hypothetical protein
MWASLRGACAQRASPGRIAQRNMPLTKDLIPPEKAIAAYGIFGIAPTGSIMRWMSEGFCAK